MDLFSNITFSVRPFWFILSMPSPTPATCSRTHTTSPSLLEFFPHLTCYVVFLFIVFVMDQPAQSEGRIRVCLFVCFPTDLCPVPRTVPSPELVLKKQLNKQQDE